MTFCPPVDFEESLFKLLSSNVLNESALHSFYSHYRVVEETFPKDHDINVRPKSEISNSQDIPETARLRGIDLAAWVAGPKTEHRIMIVGQDPLRSDAAFKEQQANSEKDVILSTPFAAHLQFKEYNNPTIVKIRRMAAYLSEREALVYFTDLYKSFFCIGDKRSIHLKERKKNNAHRDLIRQEIQLVKPELLVVFGNTAFREFHKIYTYERDKQNHYIHYFKELEVPVLHLIHPAAYGGQKTFFSEKFSPFHGEASTHEEAIWNVLQKG